MFAELTSRFPSSGSALSFLYATFGELPAWVAGWLLLPRYGAVSAGLARAMGSYLVGLVSMCGGTIPLWVYKANVFGIEDSNPLSVIFLAVLCAVNCWGTRESERFNSILTIGKIITLLLIVFVAFSRFDAKNFQPFFNETHGFQGMLFAASLTFFGVMGFDFISTLSFEAVNPTRDVPKAMRDCVLLSTSFYIVIAVAVCGMGIAAGPIDNPTTAMADQFKLAGINYMSFIIYVCGFLGLTAVAFTCLMGFIRLTHAYALEGLLPKIFTEVNMSTGIPVKASIILTCLLAPVAFFLDFEQISKLISLSQLLVYVLVCTCGIYIRYPNTPDHQELSLIKNGRVVVMIYVALAFVSTMSFANCDFLLWNWFTALCTCVALAFLCSIKVANKPKAGLYEAPGVPFIPAVGIYVMFVLCCQLDGQTWVLCANYLAIGLVIYFGYGVWHSKVQRQTQSNSDFEQISD